MKVAVIIITYNSAKVIDRCLESVRKFSPETRAVVIDNASADDTTSRVRIRTAVQLISNSQNRGFAAAVNQGVQETADYDILLLLNPDTQLLTAIDDLIIATREYGVAAGKLVDSTGQAQTGFSIRRFPTPATLIFELFGINRLWPLNAINRQYRYLDRKLDVAGPVEQPAGAFLMFRRDVWETLGGFDERFYPVWFEDVDFCRRAVNAGFTIQYAPSVVASHEGGHSVNELSASEKAYRWCDSLLKYASKHFSSSMYRVICAAVIVSSVPRMLFSVVRERKLTPLASYLRIMSLAGQRVITARS